MKYNLIFGGIEQTQVYEEVLVNFMRTELGIDDANSEILTFISSF